MCQLLATCNVGTSTIIINDKPHHCNHCGRSFAKISLLRLHLYVHFGMKPYFCNICRKEFRRGSDYKAHVNSHTGDKPFICKICNRRYIKNRYAKHHVKCHLFKKPYKCSHCMKGYFRIQELNRHVRIEHKFKARHFYNLGDRQAPSYCRRFYMCKICRKQFSSVSNRNKHQCKK